LIEVEPMLDELAAAHEGRRMFLLGCNSRSEHLRRMRAEITAESPKEVPRLHLLAMVSGMDSSAYALAHSMLASQRVASLQGQDSVHGTPESAAFSKRWGMQAQREGAYVCNHCIDEDLSRHPFSWFRRSHHLIGVDWCPEHGSALHKVDAPRPFDALPNNWRDENRTSPVTAFQARLPADGFYRRYVEIALGLMSRERPVECGALNAAIGDRARELGLRVSLKGRGKLLSDRLMELTDPRWRAMHFAGLGEKMPGEYFSRIDRVGGYLAITGTGDGYACALACLFDSSIDALGLVESADVNGQTIPTRPKQEKGKPRGVDFWQGAIWEPYIECNGNHSVLAKRLGLSRSHLTHMMVSIGLPSLRGTHAHPGWRAMIAFGNGMSLQDACAAEKIDMEEVEQLLRVCIARAVSAANIIWEKKQAQGNEQGL
jgi:hypothetical protein